MSHTPKEGLAASHAINTQPDRNTQHVSRVQKRGDDAAATFHRWRPADGLGNEIWVPRFEQPVWSEMKIDAGIGETKQ